MSLALRLSRGDFPEEDVMAVIKTIDLVGVSDESWRDAAQQALEEASKTLRNVEGFDVLETSAVVEDGEISEYHTHVRIKFRITR